MGKIEISSLFFTFVVKYLEVVINMLLMKDILDEKDKRLREVSKEVQFPLSDEKKKIINALYTIKFFIFKINNYDIITLK